MESPLSFQWSLAKEISDIKYCSTWFQSCLIQWTQSLLPSCFGILLIYALHLFCFVFYHSNEVSWFKDENMYVFLKVVRFPMFQLKGLALPPPNGAQMTRRMALTQSSMSVWAFAMSRKDSWLTGARSFSPVPPAGTNKGRKERKVGVSTAEIANNHLISPQQQWLSFTN